MKYFLIHITYTVPIEQVEAITPDHRAYLRSQFAEGKLLFSGPRVPRTGGVLFGKAEDKSVMEAMVSADPFKTNGIANYDIIEIAPTIWAEQLKPAFE